MTGTISFDGRVAIVTGAGRGMGRRFALDLAARGAQVVVNDVDADVSGAVATEIATAGGEVVAVVGSVTEEATAEAVVSAALQAFGRLDAVVNNAGMMLNGYLEAITPRKFDAVVGVSLRGSYLVTRAAWSALRAAREGRVVMITSSGGLFANQGSSNYAAAKAGLYGLCKSLAVEGEEHGIRVNAVAPMAGTMHSMDPLPGYAERYPAHLRAALGSRRPAEAVSPLVLYLASGDCAVNGEAFFAGFGRFARIFVGETRGWVAPDPWSVEPEHVAAHLDEIRDRDGYAVPGNVYEELELIGERLGIAPPAPEGGGEAW